MGAWGADLFVLGFYLEKAQDLTASSFPLHQRQLTPRGQPPPAMAVTYARLLSVAGDINGDGYCRQCIGDTIDYQVTVYYGHANGITPSEPLQLPDPRRDFE